MLAAVIPYGVNPMLARVTLLAHYVSCGSIVAFRGWKHCWQTAVIWRLWSQSNESQQSSTLDVKFSNHHLNNQWLYFDSIQYVQNTQDNNTIILLNCLSLRLSRPAVRSFVTRSTFFVYPLFWVIFLSSVDIINVSSHCSVFMPYYMILPNRQCWWSFSNCHVTVNCHISIDIVRVSCQSKFSL